MSSEGISTSPENSSDSAVPSTYQNSFLIDVDGFSGIYTFARDDAPKKWKFPVMYKVVGAPARHALLRASSIEMNLTSSDKPVTYAGAGKSVTFDWAVDTATLSLKFRAAPNYQVGTNLPFPILVALAYGEPGSCVFQLAEEQPLGLWSLEIGISGKPTGEDAPFTLIMDQKTMDLGPGDHKPIHIGPIASIQLRINDRKTKWEVGYTLTPLKSVGVDREV